MDTLPCYWCSRTVQSHSVRKNQACYDDSVIIILISHLFKFFLSSTSSPSSPLAHSSKNIKALNTDTSTHHAPDFSFSLQHVNKQTNKIYLKKKSSHKNEKKNSIFQALCKLELVQWIGQNITQIIIYHLMCACKLA